MAIEAEILLLSSLADLSTDRVCHHLTASGISFLRLNREQLPDLELQLDPISAHLTCRHACRIWHVGQKLRSVWWRQPTFLRNAPGRGLSVEEQLSRSQWPALMRGLMLFDSARWYNHPAATYQAEAKPLQLRVAHQLGFAVPRTLITNDRTAPIPETLGQTFALKSVDTIILTEGDSQYFGYTSIVDWSACTATDFQAIPSTCQRLLAPKLDLRVTVLGERVWCTSIETSEGGVEGDWRLTPKHQLIFKDYSLPAEESKRCSDLLKALGLRYGAIDLAFSDGKYWFIEINPTGEWGWLDRDGRELSQSIARELALPS